MVVVYAWALQTKGKIEQQWFEPSYGKKNSDEELKFETIFFIMKNVGNNKIYMFKGVMSIFNYSTPICLMYL